LVVQRFRITQDPVATYYGNYEKKNNQLGFILPLLRFPKVKKKWSKEPSWSIQSSRTTSRRSSYLCGNGVSAVTPCSVAKKMAASFSAERSCTTQPLQGPNPSPRHVPLLPDSL